MSIIGVIGWALNLFFFYTMFLYVLGLILPFKTKVKYALPNKNFLVIIPAHNEPVLKHEPSLMVQPETNEPKTLVRHQPINHLNVPIAQLCIVA